MALLTQAAYHQIIAAYARRLAIMALQDYRSLLEHTRIQLETYLSQRIQELLNHEFRDDVENLATLCCLEQIEQQYLKRKLLPPEPLMERIRNARNKVHTN
jgi:hypothetical protein